MTTATALALLPQPDSPSALEQITELYWSAFDDLYEPSKRDVENVDHVLAVGFGPPWQAQRDAFLLRVLLESTNRESIVAAMMVVAVTQRASPDLAAEIVKIRLEEVGDSDLINAACAAIEGLALDLPELALASLRTREERR